MRTNSILTLVLLVGASGAASRADEAVKVPPGFTVSSFLTGLTNPRIVRTAANGGAPAEVQVFATGLNEPFGMTFYPQGANPQWLYVANINSVVRFAYRNGDLQARAAPQTLVVQLSGTTRGHSTRDLVFSADGRRMLVSVGSGSNLAEGMSRKSVAQARYNPKAATSGVRPTNAMPSATTWSPTTSGSPGCVLRLALVLHRRPRGSAAGRWGSPSIWPRAAPGRASRPNTPAMASPPCMVPGTAVSAPATRWCADCCTTAFPPGSTRTSSPDSWSTAAVSGAGRWVWRWAMTARYMSRTMATIPCGRFATTPDGQLKKN